MVYNISESVHICLIPASLPFFILVPATSFIVSPNLHGQRRVIHRWKSIKNPFRMVYNISRSVKICLFYVVLSTYLIPQLSFAYCARSSARTQMCHTPFESDLNSLSNGV